MFNNNNIEEESQYAGLVYGYKERCAMKWIIRCRFSGLQKIREANTILVGGVSGMSSAEGYNHTGHLRWKKH